MDRKGIGLNLDTAGSHISKPTSCSKKVFFYAFTIHTPSSISSGTLAEMISSNHDTAEISHFLDICFLGVKLFTNNGLKIRIILVGNLFSSTAPP